MLCGNPSRRSDVYFNPLSARQNSPQVKQPHMPASARVGNKAPSADLNPREAGAVGTILNCFLHCGRVVACGSRSVSDYNGLARNRTGKVKQLRLGVPLLAGFELTSEGAVSK